ncbi:hypothetical protein Gotur_023702 [Gossypium turneri]
MPINRMIGSNYNNSPSRTIYSDRFIPSRSGSNFALFDISNSPASDQGKKTVLLLIKAFYAPRCLVPIRRVSDAPGLEDDFYLNLVDWSPNNVLAVGLEIGWAQCGTHLAVGTNNWPSSDMGCIQLPHCRTMEGHRSRVGVLAWSSSLLSSGSHDKSILQRDMRARDDFASKLVGHKKELHVWNQHSAQPVLKHCEHTASVKAIAWSPHRHGLLASGGGATDRCIRFWDAATNTHLSCMDTGSQMSNLVWSKNVNELVSTHGSSQDNIIVWRYPTMSKLATLTGHTTRVLYLAISPDEQKIVTGYGDETLCFWKLFPASKSQVMAYIS